MHGWRAEDAEVSDGRCRASGRKMQNFRAEDAEVTPRFHFYRQCCRRATVIDDEVYLAVLLVVVVIKVEAVSPELLCYDRLIYGSKVYAFRYTFPASATCETTLFAHSRQHKTTLFLQYGHPKTTLFAHARQHKTTLFLHYGHPKTTLFLHLRHTETTLFLSGKAGSCCGEAANHGAWRCSRVC